MNKVLTYIAQIFDAESSTSFARWATAFTVATGIWAMVYLVVKNHTLPDATQIAAFAAWMVCPYSVGKAAAIFGRPSNNTQGRIADISASEEPGRRNIPSDERLILCFIIVALALYALTHR